LAQIRAGRKKWRGELRFLAKMQWMPSDKIRKIQIDRLQSLLLYANRAIPYYRKIMNRHKIKPEDVNQIEQLQRLPILNKEIINEHLEDLLNPNFSGKYYKNTSSGSTGHPVNFYDDGGKAGLGVAEEALIKLNFGLPLGLKEARFVRLNEDTISNDSAFHKRAMLINQLILPGMNLSEDVFTRTKQKIFKFKPRIIFGISSAIYDFSRFLKEQGIEEVPWKVNLVICWAAPVFQHYIDLISKLYNCPVVNLYSTREVGHLASSCPEGNLHLHEENRIIEIIKNGRRAAPGESGKIVVTTLKPYAMPMIRYNTDDIGKVASEPCPCGRGLTVLKELEGRSGEILYLSNGRIISPNYCCRLMMSPEFVDAVGQFQVIQTGNLSLEIKLVKTSIFENDHASILIEKFKDSLGNEVSINLTFVDSIEPLASGKYQISRRADY
jgi:phenylacetate-CoA ligase